MKKLNRNGHNKVFLQFSDKKPDKKEQEFGGKIISFWNEGELVALDVKTKKGIPQEVKRLIEFWEIKIEEYEELDAKYHQLSYSIKSFPVFSFYNFVGFVRKILS
jgi:hypothetical protein